MVWLPTVGDVAIVSHHSLCIFGWGQTITTFRTRSVALHQQTASHRSTPGNDPAVTLAGGTRSSATATGPVWCSVGMRLPGRQQRWAAVQYVQAVASFLLWLILAVIAWPLALIALIVYPIVWLISLPLRIVGISVKGVLDLIKAILGLPARVLRGPRRR